MNLTTAFLVLPLCAACNFATLAQADATTAATAQPQTSLVKIATIQGKTANDEFTHNVQVLQAQRQEIVRLNEATLAAPAGKDRDALQAKLDAALKRLEADNQLMAKACGYSILRNYVRVTESSEIFVVLTEAEIAALPPATDGSAPSKTVKVCTLGDVQANQTFQTTVQNLQAMRQQAATLKGQLDTAADDQAKAYAQGQFDLIMKQLNEANAAATRTYQFSLNRQYVMSIEKSTLYIAATPEEAAKVVDSAKAVEASAIGTPAPSIR
ncbi:MAG: hypothetical protein EXS15_06770 [Phycisphaerales bacterium]|nr:hypothetical protein [Phycisphaerales bacterium]